MRLSEKVVIVTGAAAGMGRAVAARFAHEGASVVTADINETEGSALAEQLVAQGLKVVFVRTDVSREDDVKALVNAAVAHYGRIDVLYSNAAILASDRDSIVHELSLETWEYVMSVNLRSAFLCGKYVLPHLLKPGGGSIVYLGSPTGIVGCAPRLTAYSASKAGVIGLAKVMAAAYSRNSIRVNVIVPGIMDTPMNDYILLNDSVREQFREAVPMGRIGTPSDIEGLAVFLASDESSYCTGGIYMCDGGLTAV
jgi:NAD(P)-dependent dehydrogenase (short-subunit alcohol dehydrogenase family)